jgi:uncharacterized membrane protein YhaH (DUF805 family)
MQHKSFLRELHERAGFIGIIALSNPVFITGYVMFVHQAPGGLQFWFIGMLLTGVVCLIAALFMGLVVAAERRRRFHDMARAAMWHDVMPYDPVKAKAAKAADMAETAHLSKAS